MKASPRASHDSPSFPIDLSTSNKTRQEKHTYHRTTQSYLRGNSSRRYRNSYLTNQSLPYEKSYDDLPAHTSKFSQNTNVASENQDYHKVRRVKRAFRSHHIEILILIRLLVSVLLLTAIFCIIVSLVFGIFSRFLKFASSLGYDQINTSLASLTYVQNQDEIKHAIELTLKQYNLTSNHNRVLHSVRKEESLGLFEAISHPGFPSIKISVPRFYLSVALDGDDTPPSIPKHFRERTSGKLLTQELSYMIGSSLSGNPESDPSDRTIFVSILSNNNKCCPLTISNLFHAALNPQRIRVAVIDRTDANSQHYVPCDAPPKPCTVDPEHVLCKFDKNIDVYEIMSDMDAGAIFARHIANRMYRGEYYAMQVGYDSCVLFAQKWDEDLIEQLHATDNDMAMITTYLSDVKTLYRKDYVRSHPERISLCHASYEGDGTNRRLMHLRHDQKELISPPSRADVPILQPFWSSELSFSRGHFILNVPYDQHICGMDEQDEEISMGIRAFTHGYDFYTPTRSVVFRREHESIVRNETESLENRPSAPACTLTERAKARKYLNGLLEQRSSATMASTLGGLGSVRDVQQFFKCFGIHVQEHITEHRLCEFVISGNMHDDFTVHLRKDRMGIDYSHINFRFHELISIHSNN